MSELSGDERAELTRLRTEVARLRDSVGLSTGPGPPPGASPAHPGQAAARWAAAIALLVLASVAGVAAVVAGFVRAELLDTNQYVATVAPLARDPVMQQAVAARVSDELVTRLDIEGLTGQLIDALEEQGAPEQLDGLVGPITSGIHSFIDREVRAILATDQFAQVWDAANRVAHDELDALLTTGQGQVLAIEGDTVTLDLGAIFSLVKQRLVDAGFTLVENIPDISLSLPLVSSDQLPDIRDEVRLLEAAAWVLPLLALGLLAAGVATAPGRRRALLVGAAGFGLGMLLLLAALNWARGFYLDRLPASIDAAGAAALYDTLLRFLVTAAQTLAVFAALVVLACWLVGPSRPATGIRRGCGWCLDRVAAGIHRLGFPGERIPEFVRSNRHAIEAGLAIVAAFLILWRHPGIAGTLWLAVALAAGIGLVELAVRVRGTGVASSRPAAAS